MDPINIFLAFLIGISFLSIVKYFVYVFSAPFYIFRRHKDLLPSKNVSTDKIQSTIPISVIIPAWNEEVGIRQSIISLLNQSYENIEIIVVNDGSTDGTEKVVKDFLKNELTKFNTHKKVRYYYKPNGGKGSALNHGIRNSTGKVIVTMDADTIFDKDAIKKVARYFYNGKLKAAVGNVKIHNNRTFLGLIQQIEYTIGFYFKRSHSVYLSEYIIGGAFGAFRKEVFKQYGYFDTNNITEDIEFSTRLQLHACQITYMEDAIAFTEGPSTFLSLLKQRLRWKKGRLDTFIKYRHLFFSKDTKHKKFLTHFLLPVTLFYEFELLLEPAVILFSLVYLYYTGNYEILIVWIFFTTFIHMLAFIFGSSKNNKVAFVFTPLYFLLSYVLTVVEIYAMYESVRRILYKKEVVWQTWDRKGIPDAQVES